MFSSPWPTPTPPPTPTSHKRRRRQVITDQSEVAQAMTDCQINSGNNVFSCFPTDSTRIPQHQWATFVWNSRRPELTQTNLVDIFLFRADSQTEVLRFTNHSNPSDQAGSVSAQVDDRWFGEQGLDFPGHNVSFPFYWVIIRSDKTLDGNQVPQATFTAVQTTVLDSVASASASASASSASAAAAASSSSAAAAASSLSSLSSAAHPSNPTNSGAVQHAASSSSFPHWAIAVIVVLGFLAIAACCILAFLILRRIRRAREHENSSRNSMGSASPMIQRDNEAVAIQRYDSAGGGGAVSPLLPPPAVGAGVIGGTSARTTHDGASTISDSGGPFSGADAAIMADAFRKMLRKPDFATGRVDEGRAGSTGHGEDEEDGEERDGEDDDGGDDGLRDLANSSNVVLSRELAEEGRDIRSVSSSRGVRVETQPDR
ncbi:hypothetical protein BDN70DRAFT_936867 [Pholiota conissans]|uniref:Uncharacterized protein n=1 Tax=Pholiota conissans TaxID=109636 RepID=A0A9P6CW33_9AGAR|nr:hypothetical protein BDN70DRAFT_936867 [Pholiota conissans]